MNVDTNVFDVTGIHIHDINELEGGTYTRMIKIITKHGSYDITAFSDTKEPLLVGVKETKKI